jgi:hypothetical protein
MLDSELRGIPANKTQHRHRLSVLLDSRSHSAIERKHQNVSAILLELGLPYISGYKPLGNYQRLLHEVVAERAANASDLTSLVATQVGNPAVLPTLTDVLRVLVDPPKRTRQGHERARSQVVRPPIRVNYLELEARNRSLGSAGEELVVQYEMARLQQVGRDELAARVERVSETRGDGAGFDVLSFEQTGADRLIEVKTTAYGRETPFFVTRNELTVSQHQDQRYFLYRVFEFRRDPRLFTVRGRLDRSFSLDPSQFVARIA